LNIHTVTLPDSTTATRKSAGRTYTHAIAVGPKASSYLIEREQASLENKRVQLRDYAAIAAHLRDGGTVNVRTLGDNRWGILPAELTLGADDYRRMLMIKRGESGAAYRARMVTEYNGFAASAQRAIEWHQARIQELQEGPDLVGNWGVWGWAGRADLAAKTAEQARGNGMEVRILEATVTVK
jgi:hypothetical protein